MNRLWFGKPYLNEKKALIFPGFFWWLIVLVPWAIGARTIIGWF